MKFQSLSLIFIASFFHLFSSCTDNETSRQEIIEDPFIDSQNEIEATIYSIIRDAEEANVMGLKSAHLESAKFSKFGPRNFERQDLKSTNETEEAFFTSISDYKQEVRDLKIDVFDDVAIATYYPLVSFIQKGERVTSSGRQTFVFLRTDDGWKLIHEHGTPEK